MSSTIIAALIIGLPTLFIAYVAFWFRQRPIFWFVLALVVVGLGYLASTGALHEIGVNLIGEAETLAPAR
jgi:hypothetical protein